MIDLVAKTTHALFSNQPYVQPVEFGEYGYRQQNGRWYGYFANLTMENGPNGATLEHSFADLYRVDLLRDTIGKAAHDSERRNDWVVGLDGAVVAKALYDERHADWSLQAGGKTLMARKSPLHDIELNGLGRTADTVLLYDTSGDHPKVLEQPLAPGAPAQQLWADLPIQGAYHAHSGLLIGAELEGDVEAVFADPMRAARFEAARKAFPGYRFHLVSMTDDLKRMLVMTDGGDDPGTYWLVDISTGAAKIVAYARPGIKARDVGATRRYSYKAADGLELDGVLTLPPGPSRKNLPIVVMPHGGPIGIRDQVGFDFWAQAFASRGYAVFQPNYRGSSGKGMEFERAGYKEWGRKMLSDIADGLHALAADGVVDPRRACIVGGSYGGYAALAGVTLQHGLYRCAVSLAGISDMSSHVQRLHDLYGAGSAASRWERKALGLGEADAPSLDDISPLRKAASVTVPVLLIHGTDDTIVPIDQSRKMEAALKAAGKSVEFVTLQGDDHWLSRGDTRLTMLKASVEFVQRNNPAD